MTAADDWFRPLGDDAGVRLFAFPHAGAGPAQLVPLAHAVAAGGIAVWAASLPGRQLRLDEPAPTDIETLVDVLADAVGPLLDRPFALFGYCGGAVHALGLARALLARSARMPRRIVVASYEAPDIALRPRPLDHLPPDLLWTHLEETGGVPAERGADPRLRRLAEPAVRADFALLTGYRYRPHPPLPVPITVLRGRSDGSPRGAFLGWRRQSTCRLDVRDIDGGHWLLDDAVAELAKEVVDAVVGGEPTGAGTRA